jgi:polysaccharide export outer membrane protein
LHRRKWFEILVTAIAYLGDAVIRAFGVSGLRALLKMYMPRQMVIFGSARQKFITILALAIGLMVGGCATLPVSGPTGSAVIKAGQDGSDAMKFTVVELTDIGALPTALRKADVEMPKLPPAPSDMIGAGDVLDIAIYEAGVTLFAGNSVRSAGALGGAGGFTGAAQAEHMPPQRVDDSGYIRIPYAGRLRAAGHTPDELAGMIRTSLHGMSQNPQVAVTIQQTIANSVIIGGEVGKPGRLVLTTNRETLSDSIALAGGYRGDSKDLTVRVVRAGRNLEYRLSDVLSGAERDMRVLPGDKIALVRQSMSFSVMGAAGKVEQLPFSGVSVSLTEAVAMAGGAHPNLGDAKAIFVFRFVKAADSSETPVVYHLNMMKPGAYFVGQKFAMQDKDLLYVGNASANQTGKLIQLISQLFSPIATVNGVIVNAGL